MAVADLHTGSADCEIGMGLQAVCSTASSGAAARPLLRAGVADRAGSKWLAEQGLHDLQALEVGVQHGAIQAAHTHQSQDLQMKELPCMRIIPRALRRLDRSLTIAQETRL